MPSIYIKLLLKTLAWLAFWGTLTWIFVLHRASHMGMWLFIAIAGWIAFKKLRLVLQTIEQGRYQAELRRKREASSGAHGDARFMETDEIIDAGLTNLNAGLPYGEKDGHILTTDATFPFFIWPTGAYKTTTMVLSTLAHGYRIQQSHHVSYAAPMVVIDPKPELIQMAGHHIEQFHGHELVPLNPSRKGGYGNVCINILQVVLEDCIYEDRYEFALVDCAELVLNLISEPDGKKDRNFYFRQGGRNILSAVILYLACEAPHLCFMPEVFKIVSDIRCLLLTLKKARASHALHGDLANLANIVLSAEETQFQQFLTNAQQAVFHFSPSSALGKATAKGEFYFDNMRDPNNPKTVFIMTDLARKASFAPWVDMVLFNFVKTLIRENTNDPVFLLAEEATNFNLVPIAENITTLRGEGLRAAFLIQAISEMERLLGKHSTETMLSQRGFISWSGVTDIERAKAIADEIGMYTAKSASYSPQSSAKSSDISENVGEHSAHLFSPSDIMQLPKHQQIVLIPGQKPFICNKLGYNRVSEWWHALDENSVEGGKRPLEPIFSIDYKEVEV